MHDERTQRFLNAVHASLARSFARHTQRKSRASRYVSDRGLSAEYMARAGCGYLAQTDTERFKAFLDRKPENRQIATDLGLVSPSGRIMSDALYFPLYTSTGSVYGFSIRLMPWSDFVVNGGSRHWTMKVPINFPLGCMYPKAGLDPYNGKATFICEGATDTLTLLQNGYNAIGLIGIGNWKPHFADFLTTKATVIAFDNDANQAGQHGAVKLANKLCTAGMAKNVYILSLPEGQDINSFYDNGFYSYSKKHITPYSQTEDYAAWLASQSRPRKDNQMTDKVMRAKEADIVKLFRRMYPGVQLFRHARGWRCQCPFHTDERASLTLYTDTNSFFCFGCQASSDTISLVRLKHPEWDFNTEVLPFINMAVTGVT